LTATATWTPSTLHRDPVNLQVKGGGNLYVAVKLNVRVKVKDKVRDRAPPARNERVVVGSPSGSARRGEPGIGAVRNLLID
jgi:hypothetical protein